MTELKERFLRSLASDNLRRRLDEARDTIRVIEDELQQRRGR